MLKKVREESDFQQLINATISHEMRNPLNSIINLTQDLERKTEKLQFILTKAERTKIDPALKQEL
jgi:signal transduction histidine kinase